MEAFDAWLSSTMNETLNHDSAIRKFCPARLEQEQDIVLDLEETLLVSHNFKVSNPEHYLSALEDDEFVDSIINPNQYLAKDDIKSTKEEEHLKHVNPEILNNVYEDFSMLIDGDSYDIILGGLPLETPSVEQVNHRLDQGLHLVHMLLACAEALGWRDTKLAGSMLGEIWSAASPWGDPLQRVSYCFATGLESRISYLHQKGAMEDSSFITREEKTEAFRLLHKTTPYIEFAFLAANDAICEAAQGKNSLHIVDLGMKHCLQWPSLLMRLASMTDGPKKLQITGWAEPTSDLPELELSMKAIVADGNSLGMSIQFQLISEPLAPSLLHREKLNLKGEEALLFNCIMHLHKYIRESRGSLKATLQAMKKLEPIALVVVEQDASHNGPFFLGRFLESLHYYSAIFDSLEASLPRNSPERMKIERAHFGEEIRNIIACEGTDRVERHERVDQWRRQLGRAGFQVMGMKCMNQAKMMLSGYVCDGYTLGSEKGCLLLGWKGRPMMLASVWQVHSNVSG